MKKNPKLRSWLKLIRIRQYSKNMIIFAPVLFDEQIFHRKAFFTILSGFLVLCALSSGIYIINDLIDVTADRMHPRKKYRPIASGEISISSGRTAAIMLILLSLLAAFCMNQAFFGFCLAMVGINLAYSMKLKHIPLIDVMTIAILFLLRVGCGAILVPVKMFSPWLYVVTFMLALFLGFGKRRSELALFKEESSSARPVLDGYNIPLLDQLISIVSSVTIMAYSLYTFSGPTLPEHNKMMLTIPVVVYGIFRYQYLVQMKHEGGAPEEVLLSDRWLQAAILLYGIMVIATLYL